MRRSILAAVLAGAVALALGTLAVGMALAVPDEPGTAHVEGYLDDLESRPPPSASAAILGAATGSTLPTAPSRPVVPPSSRGGAPSGGDDVADHDPGGTSGPEDSVADGPSDRDGSRGGTDDGSGEVEDGSGSGSGSGDGDQRGDDPDTERSGSGSGSGTSGHGGDTGAG